MRDLKDNCIRVRLCHDLKYLSKLYDIQRHIPTSVTHVTGVDKTKHLSVCMLGITLCYYVVLLLTNPLANNHVEI